MGQSKTNFTYPRLFHVNYSFEQNFLFLAEMGQKFHIYIWPQRKQKHLFYLIPNFTNSTLDNLVAIFDSK